MQFSCLYPCDCPSGLYCEAGSINGLQQALGAIIALIGIAFAVLSYRTLGRNFRFYAAPRRNGKLVTWGLYSKVRHPIYTGVMAALAGWVVFFGSLVSVPFWLGFSALYIMKAAKEEQILIDRFPEYCDYIKSTWRFLPYIY